MKRRFYVAVCGALALMGCNKSSDTDKKVSADNIDTADYELQQHLANYKTDHHYLSATFRNVQLVSQGVDRHAAYTLCGEVNFRDRSGKYIGFKHFVMYDHRSDWLINSDDDEAHVSGDPLKPLWFGKKDFSIDFMLNHIDVDDPSEEYASAWDRYCRGRTGSPVEYDFLRGLQAHYSDMYLN